MAFALWALLTIGVCLLAELAFALVRRGIERRALARRRIPARAVLIVLHPRAPLAVTTPRDHDDRWVN